MRALLSEAPGGPETLVLNEVPTPATGKGELRLRVLACGINYPDVLIIEDKYQFKPERPFAPGSEVAGIVEALGEETQGWSVGDRALAVVSHGGLAEMLVLSAREAHRLPDGMNATVGAGLLLAYATTMHALIDRGQLQPGETLLVLGAAGGVGLAAVEIGKALGARVIACVSSEEKAGIAREAGADSVLVYDADVGDKSAGKALAQSIKQAVGPQGANVVYDPVGGLYTEAALRSLAWGGRHLVIGFPAGIPALPLNLALLKSVDIRGVFWGAFAMREPERNAEHIQQLFAWWREGRIKPRIDRVYHFEQGGDAIARLADRSVIGKVIVRISDEN